MLGGKLVGIKTLFKKYEICPSGTTTNESDVMIKFNIPKLKTIYLYTQHPKWDKRYIYKDIKKHPTFRDCKKSLYQGKQKS